ncbi:MAG: hypothetical protein ACK5E3_07565 [Planctomycetota bacterium]
MPQRIRTRTGPWVDGYRADSIRRFVAQRADISVASTGSPTHMPQRIRMRTGPWVDGYRADSLRRFVAQRADISVASTGSPHAHAPEDPHAYRTLGGWLPR